MPLPDEKPSLRVLQKLGKKTVLFSLYHLKISIVPSFTKVEN